MRRRRRGRPVSVPRPGVVVTGYHWAASVMPPGWCTVADVADVLSLGRHQAREAILAARVPWRMFRRTWYDPATGKAYCWRCIGVPADAVPLILLARLRLTLRHFGQPMPGRLRSRAWRARLACAASQKPQAS